MANIDKLFVVPSIRFSVFPKADQKEIVRNNGRRDNLAQIET